MAPSLIATPCDLKIQLYHEVALCVAHAIICTVLSYRYSHVSVFLALFLSLSLSVDNLCLRNVHYIWMRDENLPRKLQQRWALLLHWWW